MLRLGKCYEDLLVHVFDISELLVSCRYVVIQSWCAIDLEYDIILIVCERFGDIGGHEVDSAETESHIPSDIRSETREFRMDGLCHVDTVSPGREIGIIQEEYPESVRDDRVERVSMFMELGRDSRVLSVYDGIPAGSDKFCLFTVDEGVDSARPIPYDIERDPGIGGNHLAVEYDHSVIHSSMEALDYHDIGFHENLRSDPIVFGLRIHFVHQSPLGEIVRLHDDRQSELLCIAPAIMDITLYVYVRIQFLAEKSLPLCHLIALSFEEYSRIPFIPSDFHRPERIDVEIGITEEVCLAIRKRYLSYETVFRFEPYARTDLGRHLHYEARSKWDAVCWIHAGQQIMITTESIISLWKMQVFASTKNNPIPNVRYGIICYYALLYFFSPFMTAMSRDCTTAGGIPQYTPFFSRRSLSGISIGVLRSGA